MTKIIQKAKGKLRSFARQEDGTIAVETMIILPVMFWAYLAMYSTFDLYRMYAVQQKVAYTLGDIISRETTPIDSSYMSGIRNVTKHLSGVSSNSDLSVRVTVLYWDEEDNRHRRDWSQERGFRSSLSNDAVRDLGDRLPVMSDNERLILVETAVKYTPPFNVGLGEQTIENRVFTRPRYAPQVLYNSG